MKKAIKKAPAILFEVPKPVKQMTNEELEAFAEKMVTALMGEEPTDKEGDE